LHKTKLSDAPARNRIEKDLDTNFLVEAGAGSGKTASMVKRMVALITSGKCSVDQIAAVTFTRKAAAELRQRFQNRLEEEFQKVAGDSEEARRLDAALKGIDSCFIGTIHSFCGKMLRERPIEAGLDLNFQELDELENRLLEHKAWEQYLLESKLKYPHRLVELNDIGIAPTDLESCFSSLCLYPDVQPVYSKVEKPDFKKALTSIKAFVYKADNAIPKDEPEKGYDKLQELVKKTIRCLHFFDLSRDVNLVRIISSFERSLKVIQNRWLTPDDAKECQAHFAALRDNIVVPVMTKWREYVHYHLMLFLLPGVEFAEAYRSRLSKLNFQDLLMKSARLLREYPEVREYFQRKWHCLLVDEFQDTDPVQAEIIFFLTGEDVQEKDWHNLKPRQGSLFVVGDPKQSIYRFRRADIDIYNYVRDCISKSGGEVLKLTSNFRSVKELGNWFNPVFAGIFPEAGDSYQAPFGPLDTVRENQKGTTCGVFRLRVAGKKKQEIVEADAKMIAAYIEWAVSGNLKLSRTPEEEEKGISHMAKPNDFLILLRYKDGMDTYCRALEAQGIPVSMSGGSSMARFPEIAEFYNLLRFLTDTDNQVLLVAVLRGLFFGVSDADLYTFRKAGGNFNIFAEFPEEMEEEIRERFVGIYETLKQYLRWTTSLPPAVAVEKIATDLGLVPYTLANEFGKARCGYVYQIIELLRNAEFEGESFSGLVNLFAELMEVSPEEELDVLGENKDCVRIMNLHKAKGLEAPVVFLAHPYKNTQWPPERHVKRLGEAIPSLHLLFCRKKENRGIEVLGQPPNWEEYAKEEQAYCDAEEERLLYVAATRAKNMLIVSESINDDDNDKNAWGRLLEKIPPENVIGFDFPEPQEIELDEEVMEETMEEITEEGTDQKGAAPQPGPEIDKDFYAAKATLRKWIEPASVKGYQTVSPSALERESSTREFSGSGGLAWGSVIHRVFERLLDGVENLNAEVLMALEENGLDADGLEDVLRTVEDFKQSELWKRIEQAEVVKTEVPISLTTCSGEVRQSFGIAGDGQVIVSGVIDLLFKEADGWVIIDFKTDAMSNREDFIREYGFQVRTYCEMVEQILGETVKEGSLYSTYNKEVIRVR